MTDSSLKPRIKNYYGRNKNTNIMGSMKYINAN